MKHSTQDDNFPQSTPIFSVRQLSIQNAFGQKLVDGRSGNRYWVDEKVVSNKLVEVLGCSFFTRIITVSVWCRHQVT